MFVMYGIIFDNKHLWFLYIKQFERNCSATNQMAFRSEKVIASLIMRYKNMFIRKLNNVQKMFYNSLKKKIPK